MPKIDLHSTTQEVVNTTGRSSFHFLSGWLVPSAYALGAKFWYGMFTTPGVKVPQFSTAPPSVFVYLGCATMFGLLKAAAANTEHFYAKHVGEKIDSQLKSLEIDEKELVERLAALETLQVILLDLAENAQAFSENDLINFKEYLDKRGITAIADITQGPVQVSEPSLDPTLFKTFNWLNQVSQTLIKTEQTLVAGGVPLFTGLTIGALIEDFSDLPWVKAGFLGLTGLTTCVFGYQNFQSLCKQLDHQEQAYQELRDMQVHVTRLRQNEQVLRTEVQRIGPTNSSHSQDSDDDEEQQNPSITWEEWKPKVPSASYASYFNLPLEDSPIAVSPIDIQDENFERDIEGAGISVSDSSAAKSTGRLVAEEVVATLGRTTYHLMAGGLIPVAYALGGKFWFGLFTNSASLLPRLSLAPPSVFMYLGFSLSLGIVKAAAANVQHFYQEYVEKKIQTQLGDYQEVEKELVEKIRALEGLEALLKDLVQIHEKGEEEVELNLENLQTYMEEKGILKFIAPGSGTALPDQQIINSTLFQLLNWVNKLSDILLVADHSIGGGSLPLFAGLTYGALVHDLNTVTGFVQGLIFAATGFTTTLLGINNFKGMMAKHEEQQQTYKSLLETQQRAERLKKDETNLRTSLQKNYQTLFGAIQPQNERPPMQRSSVNEEQVEELVEENIRLDIEAEQPVRTDSSRFFRSNIRSLRLKEGIKQPVALYEDEPVAVYGEEDENFWGDDYGTFHIENRV